MTATAAVGLVAALIEAARYVSDPVKREEWQRRFDAAGEAVDKLEAIAREIIEDIGRAEWADEAAMHNPAMRKPPITGLLALIAASSMLAGCFAAHGARFTAIRETDELRAGYAVMWPVDASHHAEDYHTVQVDGRMVTTTPQVED